MNENHNSLIDNHETEFSLESFNLYSEVYITVDDLKENKIDYERI